MEGIRISIKVINESFPPILPSLQTAFADFVIFATNHFTAACTGYRCRLFGRFVPYPSDSKDAIVRCFAVVNAEEKRPITGCAGLVHDLHDIVGRYFLDALDVVVAVLLEEDACPHLLVAVVVLLAPSAWLRTYFASWTLSAISQTSTHLIRADERSC